MKLHKSVCLRVEAMTFLLAGTLVLAQATPPVENQSAATTPTSRDSKSGIATGRRQYQSAQTGQSTQADVPAYKDGEDMTTRYRPGNNKAGTAVPTASSLPVTPPTGVGGTDARKHVAGVKYQDLQVPSAQPIQGGNSSFKGIQEKGLTTASAGGSPEQNKMAIKENGISSSKPSGKPK